MSALSRLIRAAGSDRAVWLGLTTKVWTGVAGLATAVLITYSFTPELQGYHYAFFSLLGLQAFVELGVSTVITVFAAHEWSALRLGPAGTIEGDRAACSRLASILRLGLRWFGFGALALTLGLALAGILFFSHSPQNAPEVAWRGPWLALCITTGASLVLTPMWAVLLGCNQVAPVNFCRLIEGVLRSVCLWVALVADAGLWAGPIAALAAFPWSVGFLYRRYGRLFASLLHEPVSDRVNWRREMLPMQWRIAVNWVAGYFSFSLFVPALFWFQGPVPAGQMGMTWAIIGGVSGLAGTWIQVKAPHFAALAAQRSFDALERLTRETMAISVAAAFGGGVAFLALLWILEHVLPELRSRLLPTMPIVFFLVAEAVHQIPMAQSTYLRAFKQEPFPLGLVSAAIIGGGAVVGAKLSGALGMSIAYLCAVVIALVWVSRLVAQWRRQWTAA